MVVEGKHELRIEKIVIGQVEWQMGLVLVSG